MLEGEADHLPADWTPIDDVTVGYGSDGAMYHSWGSIEDWWETVPPQEACTRFRVFFPDDHQTVSRDIVDVMAALGAWCVWIGCAVACGSCDHRERREVNYLWPEGQPVEEVLHDRLSGPAEAVAPDGGRTGDVRDRLVVDENAGSQDDLEPRTRHAVDEAMDVSLLSKGGCYEVQSASDNRCEVNVINESCTCPDWQLRSRLRRLQAPASRRSRDQTELRSPTRRPSPGWYRLILIT